MPHQRTIGVQPEIADGQRQLPVMTGVIDRQPAFARRLCKP
jgi:hypothetical protein